MNISKEIAVNSHYRQEFKSKLFRNRDGSFVKCRVNGKCKVWKTRPSEFKLPVKYGLRECFYITQDNCNDWEM